ncbi:MAG: D-alanyl-D-alanine carboxypeptidase family protein [Christensenellales bacterium]|jgi:D-alanyl-D-alanine carboxypeptidase (penicillin-binding protein 5/6)
MFAKRIVPLLMAAVVAVGFPGAAKAETAAVTTDAKAAILIDNATGQVLYENNANEKMPVSGVGKMMTLYIALEAMKDGRITQDTEITVSRKAAGMGGAQAFLDAEARYRADDLIKAVSMISANDAAVALAETLEVSEEGFVAVMNDKAAELGMNDTVYVNCTGIYAEGQVSTAADIAKLGAALAQNQHYGKYGKLWIENITHSGGRETELVNSNRLIRFYDACDGIMTGSDNQAGYCMAATAQKSGFRLTAVVLGSANGQARADTAQRMLDYGFNNYSSRTLIKKGDVAKRAVPISGAMQKTTDAVADDTLAAVVQKGSERQMKKEVIIDEGLTAPLAKGDKIGTARIMLDEQIIAEIDVVCQEDIEKATVMKHFSNILKVWLHG